MEEWRERVVVKVMTLLSTFNQWEFSVSVCTRGLPSEDVHTMSVILAPYPPIPPTMKSLPFCSGVQISGDSIRAIQRWTDKILENRKVIASLLFDTCMHNSYKPLFVSLFWLALPSTSTWICFLHAPSGEFKEMRDRQKKVLTEGGQ